MNLDLIPRRILPIFAHPDDETFLTGGTLAKYAARGCEVFLLCATHGESGPHGDYEDLSSSEFAALRQRELEGACRALGIRSPLFLECADRGLAHDCWDSARDEIVRLIRTVRPDVVITFGPDGISGHPDHVALNKIVTAAFWGAGAPSYFSHERDETPAFRPPRLYYVLRSASVPQCCAQDNSGRARPLTTVIDIRDYGDRKLKAIRSYRSQKHLQHEDPATIDRILKEPEHFHRAVPLLEFTGIDTDLLGELSSAQPQAGLHRHREEALSRLNHTSKKEIANHD